MISLAFRDRHCDFYHLLQAHAQFARLRVHIHLRMPQRVQQYPRLLIHPRVVKQSVLFPDCMSHKDVVRYGQQLHNIQFLINAGNACLPGVNRGREPFLFAPYINFPLLRLVYAGQNLDEGGFSRAIFANQPVNFTGADRKGHIAQSHDTGELLGNSPQLNDVFALVHCAFLPSQIP